MHAGCAVRSFNLPDGHADFEGGADIVHRRLKQLPAGSVRVLAVLCCQPLGARSARDFFLSHGTAAAWFEGAFRAAPFKTLEVARLDAPVR